MTQVTHSATFLLSFSMCANQELYKKEALRDKLGNVEKGVTCVTIRWLRIIAAYCFWDIEAGIFDGNGLAAFPFPNESRSSQRDTRCR